MEDLLKNNQNISFSGPGTSHQKGAAERAIMTVVTTENTLLMNATLRSPEDTLYTAIWRMAMDYAVWIFNRIPDMQSE